MIGTLKKSTGKRGRQITVKAFMSEVDRPLSPGDDYTPEYYDALNYQAYVSNIYAKYTEADLSESDRRTLTSAADAVRQEREISDTSREYGYKPGQMTQQDWGDLSGALVTKAKSELKYSTSTDRQAAGDKLRGEADTWMHVGGQSRLVRSGASKKQARIEVGRLNRQTQQDADEFMTQKLVLFGYKPETIDPLTYDKKRRLLAEIGQGQTLTTITGVNREERQMVVKSAGDMRRREALEVALNPQAARGLETWTFAMQAAEKAGRYDIDTPPAYILDENIPAYIRRNKPIIKTEEIEF